MLLLGESEEYFADNDSSLQPQPLCSALAEGVISVTSTWNAAISPVSASHISQGVTRVVFSDWPGDRSSDRLREPTLLRAVQGQREREHRSLPAFCRFGVSGSIRAVVGYSRYCNR